MKIRVLALAFLLAPMAGVATEHEAGSGGELARGPHAWDQLAGGPGREGRLHLNSGVILDVLGGGSYSDERHGVDGRWTQGFVMTPLGMVGVAREFNNPPAEPGACKLLRLEAGNARALTDVRSFPCSVSPSVAGYLPAAQLVLMCNPGGLNDPVLQALDATSLDVAWTLSPAEVAGEAVASGVGVAWDCGSAAWGDTEEFWVPFHPAIDRENSGAAALESPQSIAISWLAKINAAGSVLSIRHYQDYCLPSAPSCRPAPEFHFQAVTQLDSKGAEGAEPMLVIGAAGPTLIAGWQYQANVWTRASPIDDCTTQIDCDATMVTNRLLTGSPWAAAGAQRLFVQLGHLTYSIDPTRPSNEAQIVPATPADGVSCEQGITAAPVTTADLAVIPICHDTIQAREQDSFRLAWEWTVPRPNSIDALAVTDENIMVLHGRNFGIGRVSFLDQNNGEVRREIDLPIALGRWPLGNGAPVDDPQDGPGEYRGGGLVPIGDGKHVIVWNRGQAGGSSWTLLGPAGEGDKPKLTISDAYPSIGESIKIHIEAGDAAGGYIVSWGDGRITRTADTNEITHTYNNPGLRTISVTQTFGGTTATSEILVDVGGVPPADPVHLNWVQERFEPSEQETTYFALGLIVTLIGGLLAVLTTQRRRGRMRRELQAIERIAKGSDNDLGQAQELEASRLRVRRLLMGGRIDEAQLRVLEDRINELSRDGRIESLQSRFDFLPHGFVMQVKKMLTDGRLSIWEQDSLAKALAADDTLTAGQKARVEGLLSDWAMQDSEPKTKRELSE